MAKKRITDSRPYPGASATKRRLKKKARRIKRSTKKIKNLNNSKGSKRRKSMPKRSIKKITFSKYKKMMDQEYDRDFTGEQMSLRALESPSLSFPRDAEELAPLLDHDTYKYAYISPKKITVNGKSYDLKNLGPSQQDQKLFQEIKSEILKNKLNRANDGVSKRAGNYNDPESDLSTRQQSTNQNVVDVLARLGMTFVNDLPPLLNKNYEGREVSINCPPGLVDPKESLGDATRFSYENLDSKIDIEKDGSTGNKNVTDLDQEVDLSGIGTHLINAVARSNFSKGDFSSYFPIDKASSDKAKMFKDINSLDITNPDNFLESNVRKVNGRLHPEILRAIPNQVKSVMLRKFKGSRKPAGFDPTGYHRKMTMGGGGPPQVNEAEDVPSGPDIAEDIVSDPALANHMFEALKDDMLLDWSPDDAAFGPTGEDDAIDLTSFTLQRVDVLTGFPLDTAELTSVSVWSPEISYPIYEGEFGYDMKSDLWQTVTSDLLDTYQASGNSMFCRLSEITMNIDWDGVLGTPGRVVDPDTGEMIDLTSDEYAEAMGWSTELGADLGGFELVVLDRYFIITPDSLEEQYDLYDSQVISEGNYTIGDMPDLLLYYPITKTKEFTVRYRLPYDLDWEWARSAGAYGSARVDLDGEDAPSGAELTAMGGGSSGTAVDWGMGTYDLTFEVTYAARAGIYSGYYYTTADGGRFVGYSEDDEAVYDDGGERISALNSAASDGSYHDMIDFCDIVSANADGMKSYWNDTQSSTGDAVYIGSNITPVTPVYFLSESGDTFSQNIKEEGAQAFGSNPSNKVIWIDQYYDVSISDINSSNEIETVSTKWYNQLALSVIQSSKTALGGTAAWTGDMKFATGFVQESSFSILYADPSIIDTVMDKIQAEAGNYTLYSQEDPTVESHIDVSSLDDLASHFDMTADEVLSEIREKLEYAANYPYEAFNGSVTPTHGDRLYTAAEYEAQFGSDGSGISSGAGTRITTPGAGGSARGAVVGTLGGTSWPKRGT